MPDQYPVGFPVFYANPQTAAEYTSNFRLAVVNVAKKLGYGDKITIGTAAEYGTLTQAQQVALTDEVAAYILDGRQQYFSPVAIQVATQRVSNGSFRTPLEDNSFLANFGDFATTYATSVASKATLLVAIAIVAALAFALLPGAIAKARAE